MDPFEAEALKRYGTSTSGTSAPDPFEQEALKRYGTPTGTAADSELPKMVETAAQGAAQAISALQQYGAAQRELRARGLSDQAKSLQAAKKTLSLAKKAPTALGAVVAGTPLEPQLQNIQPAEPQKSLFERALEGLDTVTAKPGRALAISAMGGPSATIKGIASGKQGTSEEFNRYFAPENVNKLGLGAQVFKGATDAIGAIPGAIAGGLTSGAGAAADLIHGKLPDWRNISDTMKESMDSGGDFARNMAVDWTTWSPLITEKVGAQSFAKAGVQAAKLSGYDKQAAKAIGENFLKAAPNVLGKANEGRLLGELAAANDLSPSAAAKVFGSQLTSEPLASGVRREVASLRHSANARSMAQLEDLAAKEPLTYQKQGGFLGIGGKETGSAVEARNAIPAQERAIAKKQFDQWAHETFASHGELDPAIKAQLDEHFKAGMSNVGSPVFAPLMNYWKELNLFGRPAYYVNNIISDAMLMSAGGLDNPARAADAISVVKNKAPDKVLFRSVAGKDWTVKEVRDLAEKHGLLSPLKSVNVGGVDLDALPSAKELAKKSEISQLQQQGKNVQAFFKGTSRADVASLGLNRLGKYAAKKWDELAKVTMFADRLAKGDSVEQAVNNTYRVLPDYTEPMKGLGTARKFAPLVSWTYRVAPKVPGLIAENPRALTAPMHLADAFSQKPDTAKNYQKESGLAFTMKPEMGKQVTKLTGAPSGMDVSGVFRQPYYDIASQILGLDVGKNTTPLAKPVLDLLSKTYTRTGIERQPALGPFHQGALGVPSLESGPDQGALSDYADMLLGPAPMGIANVLNMNAGNQQLLGPPVWGRDTEKGPKEKLRLLNQLTGLGLGYTYPGMNIVETARSPEIKAAAKTGKEIKRIRKKLNK